MQGVELLVGVALMEEDRPVLPGVNIRAATPERLIQLCVEVFCESGPCERQEEYARVFFLMHQWFMKSEDLAQAFIDLYQGCDETISCDVAACTHLPSVLHCSIHQYKAKICQAVRYWIRHFPVHFDLDARLVKAVQHLACLLQSEGNLQLKELVDLSKVPSYDWMRHMSVRQPVRKHSRKVSLVFNHLEPDELAEQLTYLEFKAFRRIHFSDFKNYAVTASLKENEKLERSIALFNGLSQWVQCMVLSKTTPQQRADVIIKFVNVAKRLRVLQNFNTLMAIVGGLTHSALARLSKTNACLPSETQKILIEYTELLSSNNNFSNYRKIYHQCTGFKIPILGVHLKDLISLHTALPDKVEGNLVNFRKMAQLSLILTELTRLQRQDSDPVDANMDLVNTLRLSLDLHYTEDEIYELSLAREPRGSVSSEKHTAIPALEWFGKDDHSKAVMTPTTPTKPVVFADWVAGVKPPDPTTINKHVHDMVEAVYKNYDHDRDGFISHAEFEAIAGNFPFIDSFCVLDADQDGMISKEEMKTYFIRANCHAVRSSFKHAFHETTYFKPTFCIHCTGLLWGLIKQGWKCKDCGINAHKHCKDLVVMECRSKGHRRSDSMSNGVGPHDLTLSAKRKISQRHRRSQNQSANPSPQPEVRAIREGARQRSHSESQDGEFYEAQPLIYDRLIKAEESGSDSEEEVQLTQLVARRSLGSGSVTDPLPMRSLRYGRHKPMAREQLMEENLRLRARLEAANEQILTLKAHIGVIRQNTISFILEQMDALNMQRDTEV